MIAHEVLDCIAEVTGKRNWDDWMVNIKPSFQSSLGVEEITIAHHNLWRTIKLDWKNTPEADKNCIMSAVKTLINQYTIQQQWHNELSIKSEYVEIIHKKRYEQLLEYEKIALKFADEISVLNDTIKKNSRG